MNNKAPGPCSPQSKSKLILLATVLSLFLALLPGSSLGSESFSPIEKTPKNSPYTPVQISGYGKVFAFNNQDGMTQFRVYGTFGKQTGFFKVSVTANELTTPSTDGQSTEQTFAVTILSRQPVRDAEKAMNAAAMTQDEAPLPEGWHRARTPGLVYMENVFGQKEYRAYASYDGENFYYFPTRNSKPVAGALPSVIGFMNQRIRDEGEKSFRQPNVYRDGFQSQVMIRLEDGSEHNVLTAYPALDLEAIRAGKPVVQGTASKPQVTETPPIATNSPAVTDASAGSGAPVVTNPPATNASTPLVTTREVVVNKIILFMTERRANANMMTTDAEKEIRAGVHGVKAMTYKLTYTDGAETRRELVKEAIITPMVPRIVEYGTKVPAFSTTRTDTKYEIIPFTKERRANANMLTMDAEKLVQAGVNGVRTIVYLITLTNGVEVARVEQSNAVTTAMLPEITEYGTKVAYHTTTNTVVVQEAIPFATINKDDPATPRGETWVGREGVNGTKDVTYVVTMVDGVETGRSVYSEKVTLAPVDKIIMVGISDVTYTKEYQYFNLGGGGVAGPFSSYYASRAKSHAMAMAKAESVFHSGSSGYLESVVGDVTLDGMASRLVNHVSSFKDPTVSYGFGCVGVRQVGSDGSVSSWYYYGCLQGSSNPDPAPAP